MDRFTIDDFLENVSYEDPAELHSDRIQIPFGYIYCIENKRNHKRYIGSTYSIWKGISRPSVFSQLRKRASQYIYEYNKAVSSASTMTKTYRPIIQALLNEGIENFRMFPLMETHQSNHLAAENYFISKYDTIKNGYNIHRGNIRGNPIGRKMSRDDKISRSNEIIAVNMDLEAIIVSDSMKLFGDYISTTKDMIKNSVRSGRACYGWFIFYTDASKRKDILFHKVLSNGLSSPGAIHNRNHSSKSKKLYKDLELAISEYLDNSLSERFSTFDRLDDLRY